MRMAARPLHIGLLYAERGVQAPLVRAYAVLVPLALVTVGFIARASRRE